MQKRIKELEEALAATEKLYRESRAKCEQLQGQIKKIQEIISSQVHLEKS